MIADLAAVLAAVCWAAANTCIARGATRGGDNGAFLSICLTMLIAGTFWLFGLDKARLPHLDPMGVLWFAVAGALTIFLGRVFFTRACSIWVPSVARRSSGSFPSLRWSWVSLGWVKHCSPQRLQGCCLFFPAFCCWCLNRDASPTPPASLTPPQLPLVQ